MNKAVGLNVFTLNEGFAPDDIPAMSKNVAATAVCNHEPAWGWSGWEHTLDKEITAENLIRDGLFTGKFVIKKRTPPASAVKTETELLVEAEKKATGRGVSVQRKKEIRNEVYERLQGETPVSYKTIGWVLFPREGPIKSQYLITNAMSDTDVDLFSLAWRDTLKREFPVPFRFNKMLDEANIDAYAFKPIPLNKAADLFDMSIHKEFLMWLWYRASGVGGLDTTADIQTGDTLVLNDIDRGSRVTVKGQAQRNIDEIKKMVQRGYLVDRISLMCETQEVGISFELDVNAAFHKVVMTPSEAFGADIKVFGGLVDVISRLVAQYGNLRGDEKAWKQEVQEFRQWLEGGV